MSLTKIMCFTKNIKLSRKMMKHLHNTKILILSTFFLLFQCGSIKDYKWETVNNDNLPSARHECGFVEANGLLYLLGGRGIKPIDIYDIKYLCNKYNISFKTIVSKNEQFYKTKVEQIENGNFQLAFNFD